MSRKRRKTLASWLNWKTLTAAAASALVVFAINTAAARVTGVFQRINDLEKRVALQEQDSAHYKDTIKEAKEKIDKIYDLLLEQSKKN